MAIPALMTRIVIQGHLAGGEEFATSLWSDQNCPTSQAQATAYAVNARSIFETTARDFLKGVISPLCGYDKVTIYAYPTGGPLSSFIGESAISGGVGTGTAALPLQSALVCTLLTGLPGRRRRGRMYFPVNAIALSSAHQVVNGTVDSFLTALQSFFNGLQGLTTAETPVVLSQVGAGSAVPVTALRADSRTDVQRRRAAGEDIVYSAQVAV